MTCCIETKGLSKDFNGSWAVMDLNLTVERGTFFGFLGPNGAGKSTTIKMLTGLLPASVGSAHILGEDLAKNPLAVKRRIGVVPEHLCLFENLTGREYLTFIGRMYGMPKQTIEDRREELLELMQLADQNKTLVLEYSHGMKKKLSIAAALIHDPELLFLDEPFEGIDPIASRTIRSILENLIKRGSTIFLTSHILEIVEKLCTHVGIINQGELAHVGSLAELARDSTLEKAFIDVVGEREGGRTSLSWLG